MDCIQHLKKHKQVIWKIVVELIYSIKTIYMYNKWGREGLLLIANSLFFSTMSCREQAYFQWDDDEVPFVLNQVVWIWACHGLGSNLRFSATTRQHKTYKQLSYVVVFFFVVNELRCVVAVRFVDIGGIVDHHYLNLLFFSRNIGNYCNNIDSMVKYFF